MILVALEDLHPNHNVAAPISNVTRGFTGHEMDDEVGLINMKGRIFDPLEFAWHRPLVVGRRHEGIPTPGRIGGDTR
jgi:hypothetical protein